MLSEEEARVRPAAPGRDDPNQYPELKKPEYVEQSIEPYLLQFYNFCCFFFFL